MTTEDKIVFTPEDKIILKVIWLVYACAIAYGLLLYAAS